MIFGRWVGVVMCCSAVGLVGCSTADTAHSSGGGATSATSAVAAPPSPAPTDAAGLAALLRRGVASVSSAHLTLNVSAGSQVVIKAEGDTKLADGKLQALDLSAEPGSSGRLRIIIVDGKTYAQLPAARNQSGKPWLLASKDSSNPTVRTLATSIESMQSAASADQVTTFTSAARRVTLVGTESLEGTPVAHYSIDVDVAQLPNAHPGRQLLLNAGVTTLPIELFIDGEGRPVKFTQDLTVRGQRTSTVFTLTKYNAPVSISAPPADQVSTS
ncbi:MAG: hypothetical protein ACRDS0_08215 [Pseudonocardiaceae bacterium]